MEKKIESLYLHFPFCRHLCNYCDFFKKVPQNAKLEISDFHRYLEDSMRTHQSLMETHGYSWGTLKTLYLGGGTPSLWGEAGAEFLKNFLDRHQLSLCPEGEFTLEVNPGSWSQQGLWAFEDLGINRFSLGVQSLNNRALKDLDRVHTLEDVYATLEYFRDHNHNFSVDFMLGLPHSEDYGRDILAELEEIFCYRPSHFSVYILTVKSNYTHFKQLPSEEWIEKEFLAVSQFLKEKGFLHYEVSNFALPQKKSRHNLAYWQTQTVAALGPSATGFFKEEALRYKWKTRESAFETELLTSQEMRLEELYMSLRSEGINLKEKLLSDSRWGELSCKWQGEGLAKICGDDRLVLTSKGYLLLDTLMNDIFVLKLD